MTQKTPFFQKFQTKLKALPITIFYKYLWEKNRKLLAKTMVVSYVLPIILEILPWYASRRKIGNYLRARRVKINHNMVTGQPFITRLIVEYLALTVLHAILDTINRHIMNRLVCLKLSFLQTTHAFLIYFFFPLYKCIYEKLNTTCILITISLHQAFLPTLYYMVNLVNVVRS